MNSLHPAERFLRASESEAATVTLPTYIPGEFHTIHRTAIYQCHKSKERIASIKSFANFARSSDEQVPGNCTTGFALLIWHWYKRWLIQHSINTMLPSANPKLWDPKRDSLKKSITIDDLLILLVRFVHLASQKISHLIGFAGDRWTCKSIVWIALDGCCSTRSS